MPASLLGSQLAMIERPGPDEHPITVSVNTPLAAIIDRIVAALSQTDASVRAQFAELAAKPASV